MVIDYSKYMEVSHGGGVEWWTSGSIWKSAIERVRVYGDRLQLVHGGQPLRG